MTPRFVWHDSYTRVTRIESHTQLINVCDMTHTCLDGVGTCTRPSPTWLIHVCYMTHSCACHDSPRIHVCDMTHTFSGGVVYMCSVLQCVAVCCSVWQCVAVCCSVWCDTYILRWSCVHVQCVAVCCSVLQCVAVCCSVWCDTYILRWSCVHVNGRVWHCGDQRCPILTNSTSLTKRWACVCCGCVCAWVCKCHVNGAYLEKFNELDNEVCVCVCVCVRV